MPTHHRPTCFQDKPLHQFEYTSKKTPTVYTYKLNRTVPQSSRPRAAITPLVSWCLWRRWDSNPRPSECKSDALAKLSYNPKQCLTSIVGLRRSIRLDKTTATLNGRMANVVGYFVPLHSLTTLATHMYIFECCLRPTSGCELLGRRISKSRPDD